jgi:selenocysteine lyase/cysteine desulfurase
VLAGAGWPAVHARARSLAAGLAHALAAQGREPAPRDETTLVSFPSADPPGERDALAERGIVVRNIPGQPWLRASVGAWNDQGDLDRLLHALRH